MAKCPYCDGRLTPEDLDRGRCAHCQTAFFPDAAEKMPVIDKAELASGFQPTLDMTTDSAMPAAGNAQLGASDSGLTQTVAGSGGNARPQEQADLGLTELGATAENSESGGGLTSTGPTGPDAVEGSPVAATFDMTAGSQPPVQEPAAEPFERQGPLPTLDLQYGGPSSPEPPSQVTLDSDVQPGSRPEGAGQATADLSQASRSGPGTGDALQRVTKIWSGKYGAESNPRTSIKTASQTVEQQSNLVIQTRVFRRTRAGKLADYDLLGQLGEGGMGVVLAARQASIDRLVAVKMLKATGAKDVQARQKFLSEAVVTGDLEHPNIVPIYDVGSDDSGALFYSMKRVKGTPWSATLGENTLQENIEILMKAADAVAFAHSRSVIHRDLKPENIMLGDFGEVLVMDWGLALTLGPEASGAGLAGTPAYMAPEMASGRLKHCGVASDIYLLGAILYEIVAGFPPHTGKTVLDCLAAAAQNRIRPTENSGELVDIALKAMATDPKDRYATVGEFQNAIRQYQSHSQSVELSSRASSELEEAKQRDDYETFARARFAFQEAYALWNGNEAAKTGIDRASAAYARSALGKGDYDLGASLLDPANPEHSALLDKMTIARREREARKHRLRAAKRIVGALAAVVFLVVSVAFFWIRAEADRARKAEGVAEVRREEADQQRNVARAEADRARKAENVAEARREEADQQRNKAEVAQLAAEAAQKKEEYGAYVARIGLAAAKIDENAFDRAVALLDECPPYLRNWEWGRLMHLCTQDMRSFDAGQPVDTVAFSPGGERLASGGWGGTVRIWDTKTGKELVTIPSGGQYVFGLAFSPDGGQVAAGTNDGPAYLKIFDARSGQLLRSLAGHGDAVLSVAYSRDGRSLLTSSYDNTARLWNLASGESQVLEGHEWWVWSAAFAPDGKRIVTACQDGSAIVWSTETLRSGPPFLGHTGPVYAAVFSPDGKRVASAGYDKRILLWDPEKVQPFDFDALAVGRRPAPVAYDALEGHTAAVRALRFSDNGKMLLSAGSDNTVRVWDVATGRLLKTLRGHAGRVQACAFAPDNTWVLSGSHDHTAKLWSLAGYEEVRVFRGLVLEGHNDAILGAAFSPDGQFIVSASRDRSAKLWEVGTGREVRQFKEGHEFLASRAAFFPDGKKLVTAAVDNTVRIWDVTNGAQLLILERTGPMAAMALSRDARFLLSGGDDKTAKLWDLSNGTVIRTLPKGSSEITAVAISPDNSLLLTGDAGGHCRLWDAATGIVRWKAEGHSRHITEALFLPSGDAVLTASIDNTVAQWDVKTGRERLPRILKHPDSVVAMAIAPDGRKLLTACADKTVRLWDCPNTTQLDVLQTGGDAVKTVAFSPDARRAVTTDAKGNVRMWDVENLQEIRFGAAASEPMLSPRNMPIPAWSAIFSPDGDQILTVGGSEACLWNAKDRRQNLRFSPHNSVASAKFSPDGTRVVTGSWDKSARIWNAQTGISEVRLEGGHSQYVNDATFSPDGSMVVTAGDDARACIWDANSGQRLQTLRGHRQPITSAVFSPDGTRVLTASADKTARIWDARTAQMLLELAGHEEAVLDAEFSSDGKQVITGGDDNQARLWNAMTGKQLHFSLQGHTAGVASVAFSPDGRRAITGSLDNTAKLWDATTGKELLALKGHAQEITIVDFSPDGRIALTGSRDGTLMLWLTTPWRSAKIPAR